MTELRHLLVLAQVFQAHIMMQVTPLTLDIGQSVGTTDNVTFNDVTVSGTHK